MLSRSLKKVIKSILPQKLIGAIKTWGRPSDPKGLFDSIYNSNSWRGVESKSGRGSDSVQAKDIIINLPQLLERYEIRSILDIPCGDLNWMKHVDLKNVNYIGGDIVEKLIDSNRNRFSQTTKTFSVLDLMKDDLPKVDLIFCRDCLVHFSNADIALALKSIVKSKSRYLLTTSFYDRSDNKDIVTGRWRPINLQLSPFLFPEPIDRIIENCTEGAGKFSDKSLMLWSIESIANWGSSAR